MIANQPDSDHEWPDPIVILVGPWEAAAEEDRWRVSICWNKDPIRQANVLVSRVVQERVQKPFDLDYDN